MISQGLQEVERGVLASINVLGRSGGGRALREGAEEHLQGRQGEVIFFILLDFLISPGEEMWEVVFFILLISPGEAICSYFVCCS